MRNYTKFHLLSFFLIICSIPSLQAATFTVNNLNDSGAGSLRQAIDDANATAGADIINITVSGTLSVGATLLPTITEAVTISDGANTFIISRNTGTLLTISGADDVNINGIGFEDPTADKNTFGVNFIVNGNRNIVQNCSFDGLELAIRANGGEDFRALNNTFNNCGDSNQWIFDILGVGLHTGTSTRLLISGNTYTGGENLIRLHNMDALTIVQSGPGEVVLPLNDGKENVIREIITLLNINNASLSGFDLSSNSLANGRALTLNNCDNFSVTGNTVTSRFEGFVAVNCDSLLVHNNTLTDISRSAIKCTGGTKATVTSNTLTNTGFNLAGGGDYSINISGVLSDGVDRLNMSGNTFNGGGQGIRLQSMPSLSISPTGSPEVLIPNNDGKNDFVSTVLRLDDIDNTTLTGFDFTNTVGTSSNALLAYNSSNLTIDNNTIVDRYQGILTNNCDTVTISNNTISNIQRSAIKVQAGTKVAVTNNTMTNTGFNFAGGGDYSLYIDNILSDGVDRLSAVGNTFNGGGNGIRLLNMDGLTIANTGSPEVLIPDNDGKNTFTGIVLRLDGIDNTSISNFDLSHASATSGTALYAANSSNLSITNNTVVNRSVALSTINCDTLNLSSNILTNILNEAIRVQGGIKATVQNNTLTNTGTNTSSGTYSVELVSILSDGVDRLDFSGNTFNGGRDCLYLQGMDALTIANTGSPEVLIPDNDGKNTMTRNILDLNDIDNTTIENFNLVSTVGISGTAIYTVGSDNITIQNNTIGEKSVGILVLNSQTSTVTSNNLTNVTSEAIRVSGGNDATITNNTLTATGTNTAANTFSLELHNISSNGSHRLTCTGNTFTSCRDGIYVESISDLVVNKDYTAGVTELHLPATDGRNTLISRNLKFRTCGNFTIDNLDLRNTNGSPASEALLLEFCDSIIVSNLAIDNNNTGLLVNGGFDNLLTNNRVENFAGSGINTLNTFGISVIDNLLIGGTNASQNTGAIRFDNVSPAANSGVLINASGNKFRNCIRAFSLKNTDDLTFSDGSVANTNIAIVPQDSAWATSAPIFMEFCHNPIVSNISFKGFPSAGRGLDITGCDAAQVSNCTFSQRSIGIRLIQEDNHQITNCSFEENTIGLFTQGFNNTNIMNATVSGCNIICNGTGLDASNNSILNAAGNFWGTNDGSSTDGGSGDTYNESTILNNEGTLNNSSTFLTSEAAGSPIGGRQVYGNNMLLSNGQTGTSNGDTTDFGTVNTLSTLTRPFYIKNNGSDTLFLNAITSDNVRFSISNAPAFVLCDDSVSFDVTFDPNAAPIETATINIETDNCYNSDFDFNVSGAGLVTCDIAISGIAVTDEECSGADDGALDVSATCTSCTSIEYSTDSTTWVAGNVLTGLADGMYTVYVRDSSDHTCNASMMATIAAGVDTEAPTFGTETFLYSNDYETPSGVIDPNSDAECFLDALLTSNAINDFYGPGWQQIFTVEPLLIDGPHMSFSDPSNIGESYAIGMLKGAPNQEDRLSYSFNIGTNDFLNIEMDISPIDLQNSCANNNTGPGVFGTDTIEFTLTLYDTPGGTFNINNAATFTVLDQKVVKGNGPASNSQTFNWKHISTGMDGSTSTDGNVTLYWNLTRSNYGAFDNLDITASNTAGENLIPEDLTISCLDDLPAVPTILAFDNCDPNPVITYTQNPMTPSQGDQTITRSWFVTDASTNVSATETQTITLDDVFAPNITAPADITVDVNNGCVSDNFVLGNATVTDNCNMSITPTNNAAASYALGTHNITWTADDGNGQTATDTQMVTVVAPDINIQGLATTIASGDITPSAADGTDFDFIPENITVNRLFSIQNLGTGDLNLTGSPTIEIIDGPEFSVITNIFPPIIASGDPDITFEIQYDPTGIGIDTATVSISSDDCDVPVYTFAIRAEAISSCDLTIDSINITDAGCPGANDGSLTVNASCLACPSISYSTDSTTWQASNVFTGLTNTVYTVYARSNFDFTCNTSMMATVGVLDTTPPTAVCQDITIYLDGAGMASIVAGDVDGGSNDNCGSVSLSIDSTSFDCSKLGANTVVLTVSDGTNTAMCNATVTVTDTIAPTIACNDITVSLDSTGAYTLTPTNLAALASGSSDNCTTEGALTITSTPSSFDCNDVAGQANNLALAFDESTAGNGPDYLQSVSNVGITGNADRTLEFWVRMNETNVFNEHMVNWGSTGVGSAFGFYQTNNSELEFYTHHAPGGWDYSTGHFFDQQEWYHIAASYNGSTNTVSVFVNGIPAPNPTHVLPGAITTTSAPLLLAVRPDYNAATFSTIDLDEVRIWDYARTQSEIMGDMNIALNGNEPGLALYYDMENDGPGTTQVIDKTANNNHGTLINMDPANDWIASGSPVFSGGTPIVLEVTDASGVTSTSTCAVTVTVNTNLTVGATPIDESCVDADDGQITATVSGGTGPYTFILTRQGTGSSDTLTGTSPQVFMGLSPDDYILSIEDAGGCSGTTTASVGASATPCCDIAISAVAVTNEVCPGADDGALDVTATCTTCSTIEYSTDSSTWVIGNMLSGLADGMYTVYVRDSSDHTCNASSAGHVVSAGDTTDTDSDNVPDCIDLDDDNDGILDVNELVCDSAAIASSTPVTITETFGAGTDPGPAITEISNSYTYSTGPTDDGFYSIATDTDPYDDFGVFNNVWFETHGVGDNTGDNNGYFLLINGSAPGQEAFRKTFKIVPNSDFTVSVALINLGPAHPINPNLTLRVENSNGVLLDMENTGSLLNSSWVTYTLTGMTSADDQVDLVIISNSSSGAGNDYGVDDVSITYLPLLCDRDEDNISDSQELDSDNDGCFDVAEAGYNDPDDDGILGTSPVSVDSLGRVLGEGGYTGATNEDAMNPMAICQDITVYLDGAGMASIIAADVDNGSSDNCGGVTVSIDSTNFDCSELGANTVVLTAVDGNGNMSTCNATVTVVDSIAPTVTCQDVTVYLDGSGMASITAADVDGGSSDNCGSPSLSVDVSAFDCSSTGANTVVLTASDGSNMATCSATVTVIDSIAPMITCPGDMTVDTDTDVCDAEVALSATLSDNCDATVSFETNPVVSIEQRYVVDTVIADLGTGIPQDLDFGSNGNLYVAMEQGLNHRIVEYNGTSSSILSTIPHGAYAPLDIEFGSNGDLYSINSANGFEGDIQVFDAAGVAQANLSTGINTNTLWSMSIGPDGALYVTHDGPSSGVVRVDPSSGVATPFVSSGGFFITFTSTFGPNGNLFVGSGIPSKVIEYDGMTGALVGDFIPSLSGFPRDIVFHDDGMVYMPDGARIVRYTSSGILVDTIVEVAGSITELEFVGDDIYFTINGSSNSVLRATPTSFTTLGLGTTSVTATATDAAGNVDSCTYNVTVEDNQAPTAVCQDVTVYLDGNGMASITANDVDNGSSDNCSVSVSVDSTSFNCAHVGANTVVLTASDGTNTSTCSATVMVLDTIPPTAVCQDVTVYLDGNGMASITANDIDNGSSDNCSISVSVDSTSFDCSKLGPNTVVLTASDGTNTSTCSATVMVIDSIPPTAVCQDVTVYLDGSGMASITANDIDNGSSDNCGLTLSVDSTSFDCSKIGANTVVLTASDGTNMSTCSATVTVLDSIPPTAVCQDVTVYLDGSGMASITVADINNGSSDNCSLTLAVDSTSFDCSKLGANTVVLTASDGTNTSTCSATVMVLDTIPPTAVCQDITVYLGGSGMASIIATDIDNGSSDNCGSITSSLDVTDFDCSITGANTVTLSVYDGSNTSTCTATVTVIDSIPPMITCPADQTINTDSGICTASAPDLTGDAMTSDNCEPSGGGGSSTTYLASTFSMGSSHGIAVADNGTLWLWGHDGVGQFGNGIGNSGNATPIQVGTATNWTAVSAGEAFNLALANGNLYAWGQNNGGQAGNGTTSTVNTISQIGTDSDWASISAGYTHSLALKSNGTAWGWGSGTSGQVGNGASSNVTSPVQIGTDSDWALLSAGRYHSLGLKTDGTLWAWGSNSFGRLGTAAGSTNAPVQVGTDSDWANISAANGHSMAVKSNGTLWTWGWNLYNQLGDGTNISSTTPIQIGTDTDWSSVNGGSVHSLAYKTNGTVWAWGDNQYGQVGDGTNVDKTVPVQVGTDSDWISVTAGLNNSLGQRSNGELWSWGRNQAGELGDGSGVSQPSPVEVAGFTSNTGSGSGSGSGLTVTQSPAPGSALPLGNNTITLSTSDPSGNIDSCHVVITVEDNEAPTAACQDVTVYLDGNGMASITANDVDNGSSDNCSVSVSVDSTSFDCSKLGANTVVLTATDGTNTATCNATVMVLDTIPPTALCQDVTVYLDGNGMASITANDIDNGSSDNCSVSVSVDSTSFDCSKVGANTVVLTASDGTNTTTCSATVTVLDTIPPTAVCQDVTVYLDGSGMASITANDIDNGSNDNCGLTLSVDSTSFDCSKIGANTVVLTASDGNYTSTCSATVTVLDSIPPTAVCQDVTVYLDGSGMASITAADVNNGSSDNCGSVSVSVDSTSFDCSKLGPNTVVLTANDGTNTSTCTATITVLDSIAPVANCQDITVYLDGNGSASITPAMINNGSSDNCGITSMTLSQSNFGCMETGMNTVTLTVADAANNQATCTSTVMVLDTIGGSLTCGSNLTYYATPAVCTLDSSLVDLTPPAFSGNCPLDTVYNDAPAIFPVGTTTVTWTAVDDSGDTLTCSFDVWVIKPNEIVGNGIDDDCDGDIDEKPIAELVAIPAGSSTGSCVSNTDCCTDTYCYGLVYTPNTTGILANYTTGFITECIDGNNTVITNASCIMNDNSVELVDCANGGILFNSSGNGGTDTVYAEVPVTIHQICFNVPPNESIEIIEDFITGLDMSIDLLDNSGTVTENPEFDTLTVYGNTPPSIASSGPINDCYPDEISAIQDALANTTAIDDCTDSLSILYTGVAVGSCNTAIRIYVSDDCGLTDSIDYATTIDGNAPIITGTLDVTVVEGCDTTVAPPVLSQAAHLELLPGTLSIADGCTSDANLALTYTQSSTGSCPIVMTRVYTVTDLCGNSESLTHTIHINDTTNPNINGSITATTIEGCSVADAPVAVTSVAELEGLNGGIVITDACHDSTLTVSHVDFVIPGCTIIITRVYSITDECGNMSQTVHVINVTDSTAPVLTAGSINSCYSSLVDAVTAAIDSTSYNENCAGAVTFTADVTGACPSTIDVIGTDVCGNSDTVSYTATIFFGTGASEVGGPAATSSTIQTTLDVVPVAAPVFEDACGNVLTPTGPTIGGSYNPGDCQGTITYSYEYTDCSGMDTTWTYTYNVDCQKVNIKVYIEGAYNVGGDSLRTDHNNNHLLPGQDHLLSNAFAVLIKGVDTPFGHPYQGQPWNYTGTTGDTYGDASAPNAPGNVTPYPNHVFDWVLVSVRENGIGSGDKVWECAGWLHSNGEVSYPDGCPTTLNIDTTATYHVVVEHRNSLPVMQEATIESNGDYIDVDFTISDSYAPVFRFGQKEIGTGVFGMYSGNGRQVGVRGSINSADRTVWRQDQNGIGYFRGDYDLDVSADSADETLWKINQNKTSGIQF